APMVGDLLSAAPRLLVLATSRAPLRLTAEYEYPVSPFALPDPELRFESLVQTDALRLFIARARAVDPAFELDQDGARDVARICARLDGLPLAIELAAARSKLLGPGEILERLARQPHLFGTGRSAAPAPCGVARRARRDGVRGDCRRRRHDRPARPAAGGARQHPRGARVVAGRGARAGAPARRRAAGLLGGARPLRRGRPLARR